MTAGMAGVVRSEWVKLRSLRSTVLSYAAVGTVLVALYAVFLTLPTGTSDDPALTAFLLAELLVAGIAVLAAGVGWPVAALAAHDAVGSPADPLVLHAALGTALALGCVVVLGVALGSLTRSPAGGLTLGFVLLVVPVVVVTAPEVTAYLPGRAAQALALPTAPPEAHLLPPWAAGVVLVGWAVVAALVAGAALHRRDV